MPPATRVFANRYELGEEIGHGGMADVYLAHDRLLDRRVAVKVLAPAFASDPNNVERFRREAQSAAGLNHPHIVAVYDWGEEDGTPFIVMEYVPGQTLREVIDSYGHLSPFEAGHIAAEIADALSFAHLNRAVHRDVKTGNVLITPQGQVKVTDFGIARAEAGESLTKTGAVLGTATYFSPEQAQGFALDGRSDVYALGVVLFEMLTGVTPFTAATPVSVAYKHVRETAAAPSTIVADIPGAMDRIVLTAMAKSTEARYQSAQDLRGDLLRFERGRPLVGGPAPAAGAAGVAGGAQPSVVVAAPVAASPAPTVDARPRRRGNVGAIVAVGIALVLLLALIGVLLSQANIGGGGSAGPTLDVPPVVGIAFGQADAALKGIGFTVQRVDADEPAQAPDIVLAQSPEAGRKIEKGGLITLRVSSPTIKMPDIVGQSRANATQTLNSANLAPKFVEVDSSQPPGTVLSTDPPAGTAVAKLPGGQGRPTVNVSVAREPAIPVPDVSTQDIATANTTLTALGFQVTVTPTASDTVPIGKVIGTDPAAGTPVPRGSAVKLLVSLGPTLVTVQSMVGQTRATAESILHDSLGFGIAESFVNAGASRSGKVVSQAPTSGQLPKGSTITLVIGL